MNVEAPVRSKLVRVLPYAAMELHQNPGYWQGRIDGDN